MVGIIGAGITGLVAAWILKQNGVPFRLYEASDQAGGAIQTLKTGPYRLEHGPHTLQLNDEIFPLLESLELDSQLIAPRPYAAKRFILRDGRYQALPRGPKDLLFNPALSPHAKWRVLREASVKSRIQTG
ncbi:MAG: FAD-dependent oxidoreductase, partial [Bacteroidota bacterium]